MMDTEIRIAREGERILLIKNGVLLLDLPYQAALEISLHLRTKAKEAEAEANAQRTIDDQALLIRSGAPFGLTRNRAMLREATKEAQCNRLLRRYIPGGIRSRSIVGTPTIIQHSPKGASHE